MDNDRVEHLKLIQAVVARMAGNSTQLKTWGVTIVAALAALATKEAERAFIYVGFIPILAFGILDAYYLAFEQQFRDLYDLVRRGNAEVEPFGMTLPPGTTKATVFDTLLSRSVWVFWGALAAAVWIAAELLIRRGGDV
jgi:hypothetical protein